MDKVKMRSLIFIYAFFFTSNILASGSYGGSSSTVVTPGASNSGSSTTNREAPKTTYIDYSEKIECKDKDEEVHMCENVVGATKKYFCKKKGKRLLNFQIISKCKDGTKTDEPKKTGTKVKSQDF